jgi:secreted PhoX family phosphatase
VKVSSGGSLLGTFMGGGLNFPDALAISGTGSVWVANANGSVSLFTNAGVADSPAAGFTGNGLDVPSAIAIDSSGNVWVANSGSNSVTELLGAADPVVTPLATAAASGTVGTKP